MINYYIGPKSLYRLPWTMPDNGITWLEPTAQCNLNCYGCYRKSVVKLAEIPLLRLVLSLNCGEESLN